MRFTFDLAGRRQIPIWHCWKRCPRINVLDSWIHHSVALLLFLDMAQVSEYLITKDIVILQTIAEKLKNSIIYVFRSHSSGFGHIHWHICLERLGSDILELPICISKRYPLNHRKHGLSLASEYSIDVIVALFNPAHIEVRNGQAVIGRYLTLDMSEVPSHLQLALESLHCFVMISGLV